jgi:type IV secretion system protein VirB8
MRQKINKWFSKLKNKLAQLKVKPSKKISTEKNYFTSAKSWADDIYTATIASRNRYRTAFYWVSALASCLALVIIMLVPLQHTEYVVIHQTEHGTVWVEPLKQKYAPKNKTLAESEIVRYVINRENYDPSSYDEQYSLINLLSDAEVAVQYGKEQSINNKNSPINILSNKGYRTVHIENVVFLDSENLQKRNKKDQRTHANLAQVNFTITDHDKLADTKHTTSLVALISWTYRGTPQNPEDKWRNWDGFTVTRYSVEQRNI